MSYTSISDKIMTARKQHQCQGCYVKIPKGEKVRKMVGVFEGDFGVFKVCIACSGLLNDFPDKIYDNYEIQEGAISEIFNQYEVTSHQELREIFEKETNFTNKLQQH